MSDPRTPVQIPTTPELRERLYAAAAAEGLKFATWARRLLTAAAERIERKRGQRGR